MPEKYQIETRSTHPDHSFETRAMNCPDGVTRIVTFRSFIWRDFDRIIKTYYNNSDEYPVTFCADISSIPDEYNHTFSDVLHYWISLMVRQEKALSEGKSIIWSDEFNAYAAP